MGEAVGIGLAAAEPVAKLGAIQTKHHRMYMAPQMRKKLRKQGIRVSRKRIARLLKENGLNATERRKFIPTTNSNHRLPVCESILNWEFRAAGPGEKRVSGIIYLHTTEGLLCLTIVLDLFDRKVIGRALGVEMTAEHTAVPALAMTCMNRRPKADLIFYSGRGGGGAVLRGIVQAQTEEYPTVRQS
jgi:transposase InsO family protein